VNIPNLAGVATSDLVESIGSDRFKASYINWSRTVHLLRVHAPGWMPELVLTASGDLLHPAPCGAYLLIRFRNGEEVTPPVPQAVMDSRNASIPIEKITARDVTDTHRRGVCMAAAFTFGLAYELWAKLPLESGYAHEEEPDPHDQNFGLTPPKAKKMRASIEAAIQKFNEGNEWGAWEEVCWMWDHNDENSNTYKMAVWDILGKNYSSLRSAIKRCALEAEKREKAIEAMPAAT